MPDADAEMIEGLRNRTLPASGAKLAQSGFLLLAAAVAFIVWRRYFR